MANPTISRTVTRHTTGGKSPAERAAILQEAKKQDAERAEQRQFMERSEQLDREYEQRVKNDAKTEAVLREARRKKIPGAINELLENGIGILVKDILSDIYLESLVHDDYVKRDYRTQLRQAVAEHFENIGGLKAFREAATANNTKFLQNVLEAAKKVAKKVAERKREVLENDPNALLNLTFELDSEEEEEFDYEKKNLDVDTIVDLVKNNVLTVIKDENRRQVKQKALDDELASIAAETGKTVEQVAKESFYSRKAAVREATLFTTLMEKNYRAMLKVAKESIETDVNGVDINDEVSLTTRDLTRDEYKEAGTALAAKGEYTLQGEIAEYGDDDDDKPSRGLSIDMDMVLAESALEYTLLEMFDTLRISTLDAAAIKKYSEQQLKR